MNLTIDEIVIGSFFLCIKDNMKCEVLEKTANSICMTSPEIPSDDPEVKGINCTTWRTIEDFNKEYTPI